MGGRFSGPQAQGNRADGTQIRSDIFAAVTIAARCGRHQIAAFISKANGQTVEFGLGRVFDCIRIQRFTHALIERSYFIVLERIGQ